MSYINTLFLSLSPVILDNKNNTSIYYTLQSISISYIIPVYILNIYNFLLSIGLLLLIYPWLDEFNNQYK